MLPLGPPSGLTYATVGAVVPACLDATLPAVALTA